MDISVTHTVSMQKHQEYNAIAHCYEQGRADYPPESIQCLIAVLKYAPKMIICDLAAGTGKLTKALLCHIPQAHVIAIEPSQEMCAEFRRQLPFIELRQGSAEHIPLADESVDLVVVGTAFHWFANEQSLREIARILKPGGKLVLIWNVFNTNEPWVKKVRSLLDRYRDTKEQERNHDSLQWRKVFNKSALFESLQHTTYRYGIEGSQENVIFRIRASKIFGMISKDEQEQVIADAHVILGQHNVLLKRCTMPYRVEIYWTAKR